MKKSIVLIVFILIGLNVQTNAQIKHLKTKGSNIIIEGVLDDNLITKYGMKKFELSVSHFSANILSAPYDQYEDTVAAKKTFRFNIPADADKLYVSVQLFLNVPDVVWDHFDNTYIVEKGDHIKCHLSNKFYVFSGKGSDKLNCQSEIYRYSTYGLSEADLDLLNQKKYVEYFNRVSHVRDSLLRLQLEVVKRYSSRMGKEMSSIMRANCYGLRYYGVLRDQLINVGGGEYDLFRAYLKSDEYKRIDLSLSHKLASQILVASPVYVDFLFQKIVIENIINDIGNIEQHRSATVVKRIFTAIMSSYSGLLKEKLLTTFLLHYKSTDTQKYWPEILSIVKYKGYRDVILQQIKWKETDIPFFPFELKDSLNNTVTLTAVGNKVAIFDFWYTGCENCIVLNEAMIPVFEKYKDNPRVEFVSISIDKNRDMWLKSVHRGIYTHLGSLNLYTGGLGYNHPLIKHYNITGYPTLFLLKDGKMFAATPERPISFRGKPTTAGSTGRFIALIESALKIK